jgi:hypothetical protein
VTADPRPVYDLLPAVHRSRDAELGYPLRSLLAVVEQELLRLRADIDDLYDDWFAETCAVDLLPYLADLLGPAGPAAGQSGVVSQRALVANTVAHRRRKGTPETLGQVAGEVTGWPVRAVEYFRLLVTTQHLHHPRPGNVRTPDLRDPAGLAPIGTPFDTAARTVDVRHVDTGRGRYNIGCVGLHVWRLEAYPCVRWDARPVDVAAGRWTFDPAGHDRPLFTRPPLLTTPEAEGEAPQRLRRLTLHRELLSARDGGVSALLGGPEPVVAVALDDGPPVEAARLISADLGDWTRPAPGDGGPMIALDPHLGRLTVAPGVTPERIRVDFAYGAAGDLGAGPYDRRTTLAAALAASGTPWPERVDWQLAVSRDQAAGPAGDGTPVVATLRAAVAAWNARPDPRPGQVGVIAVRDSATYHEELTDADRIVIAPGTRLLILAAGGTPAALVAVGARPHLVGDIEVIAPDGPAVEPTELVLDGLSVEGRVGVAAGDLNSLVVSSCTLTADRDGLHTGAGTLVAEDNPRLAVRLLRTVCAAVRLRGVPWIRMTDSAVHGGNAADAPAVDAEPADVELEACTVLGRTTARSLTVSNSILRGRAEAVWRQQGYLRFSYAPLESRVPRRYRCQPEFTDAAERVGPAFTSLDPGHPGFCRLSEAGPAQLARGADDGGEMGVFHFLQQPRRLADLAAQLDGYLRFGLEAGVCNAD